MKSSIVADESVDTQVVDRLRTEGRTIVSVAEESPGIDDSDVLGMAEAHRALLLTADKDFGDRHGPGTTGFTRRAKDKEPMMTGAPL